MLEGFPGGVICEESSCQWGDLRNIGSIPGSGRSPEGNDNPL